MVWLKDVLKKIYEFERNLPAFTSGHLSLVWASDQFKKTAKIGTIVDLFTSHHLVDRVANAQDIVSMLRLQILQLTKVRFPIVRPSEFLKKMIKVAEL